jgi:hypothetical protein
LVSLLIGFVHTGLALQQAGVIDPLGSATVTRLAGSMRGPMLNNSVMGAMGLSGEQMSQNMMVLWDDVNQTTRSGAGALLALIVCGFLLAGIAALYLIWLACWLGPVEGRIRTDRQRSGPVLTKGGK